MTHCSGLCRTQTALQKYLKVTFCCWRQTGSCLPKTGISFWRLLKAILKPTETHRVGCQPGTNQKKAWGLSTLLDRLQFGVKQRQVQVGGLCLQSTWHRQATHHWVATHALGNRGLANYLDSFSLLISELQAWTKPPGITSARRSGSGPLDCQYCEQAGFSVCCT